MNNNILNKDNENSIGQKIKSNRLACGISQKELASVSGISLSSIKKYENNIRKPKFDQLSSIAKALHLPEFFFLDMTDGTDDNIMSLLYLIDENAEIKFSGKERSDGSIDPDDLKISIKNRALNERLSEWAAAISEYNNVIVDNYESVEDYEIDKEIARKKLIRMKQVLANYTSYKMWQSRHPRKP